MLAPEDFMVIQALVDRGVYRCDIAEQLGVHHPADGPPGPASLRPELLAGRQV